MTDRQQAIRRMLVESGVIKRGLSADGLALGLDVAVGSADTEQDIVDVLTWATGADESAVRPLARSMVSLYEPAPAPAILAHPAIAPGLDLLRRDLEATGLRDRVEWVHVAAVHAAEFFNEPAALVQKVVEDVQQRLQDEFVDTTWPACPRHPNHPLEYEDGAWHCPRGGAVQRLGELSRIGR